MNYHSRHEDRGMELFTRALEKGDLESIKSLVTNGFNVNYGLHEMNHLRRGALSLKGTIELTPLGRSIVQKNEDVTKFLLEKGALVNSNFIDYALFEKNFPLTIQMIHHSYDSSLFLSHSIFDSSFTKQQSTKILDAIIKKGGDVDEIHKISSIFLYAVEKNNLDAVKKLVSNGVNLDHPHFYDFIVYRSAMDQSLLVNHVDPELHQFLRSLKNNPNLQQEMVKENILNTLDSIPKREEFSNIQPHILQKMTDAKDVLKNEIKNSSQDLSLPVLKRVQARIYNTINHPMNKQSLTYISKILDQNNMKSTNNENMSTLSSGLPYHVARLIEDKVNSLSKMDTTKLKPIYRLVEKLHQEISSSRRTKVLSFDYDKMKINASLKELN